MAAQVMIQAKSVALTLVWSGVVSFVLFKLIDITIGLRVSEDAERQGLDTVEHGERAYG
jgi:Amt family ammonium transporter